MEMETEKENYNNKSKKVWEYFLHQGKDMAKCKKCNRILKCSGGSTSGLHSHLKSQHSINLLKRNDDADIPLSSTSSTLSVHSKSGLITNYFKITVDETLSAVISRMVARDTLPFSKFCNSYDIRKLLIDKGFTVPKSPNSIKEIVMKYGDKMRNEVCQDISNLLNNGEKFSLTFDEWTSIKNRRYMNINIHVEKTYWNLGLSRIHGSMPANKCIELLESKLNDFGININNIVGITTDGAAIMKKVGSDLNTIHQLCFAHGIQLAVIQILYKQNVKYSELEQSISSDEESNNENFDNSDADLHIQCEPLTNNGTDISYKDVNIIIAKIRKVVKIFRLSPTKNEILQNNIVQKFGKNNELELILDTKTRWNSLLHMLERFYQLRSCIRKSLIDINYDWNFSEVELNTVNEIIKALQPIRLTVESLGSSDFTLLNADVALKFMLDELLSQNTPLSKELHSELIYRIQQRRTEYSDVLQYLHHPTEYKKLNEKDLNGIFNKLSKIQITNLIVALIGRMTIRNSDEPSSTDLDLKDLPDDEVAVQERNPYSMEERLHLAIKQNKDLRYPDAVNTPSVTNIKFLERVIKREITLFEMDKVRGKYLELSFKYLLAIKPTSVESERAFSAAGQIVTKIRSSLNDTTLNTICFLRGYFNKQFKIKENGSK